MPGGYEGGMRGRCGGTKGGIWGVQGGYRPRRQGLGLQLLELAGHRHEGGMGETQGGYVGGTGGLHRGNVGGLWGVYGEFVGSM